MIYFCHIICNILLTASRASLSDIYCIEGIYVLGLTGHFFDKNMLCYQYLYPPSHNFVTFC